MSCGGHEDAIVDVARGVAGEVERVAVREHVESCAECSARLRRERALTEGLRALDRATPGEGPSSAVESALMAAFLERQAASRARHSEDSTPWLRWATAAALVVAVLGGVTLLRQGLMLPTEENLRLAARPLALGEGVEPLRSAAPTGLVAATAVPVAAGSLTATGSGGDSAVPATVGTGRPGGFVPWPGAATLPAFENGELVRTEVPASVLPLLGIGGATPAAARVPVDVVVGQDGYARAVRLAHQ